MVHIRGRLTLAYEHEHTLAHRDAHECSAGHCHINGHGYVIASVNKHAHGPTTPHAHSIYGYANCNCRDGYRCSAHRNAKRVSPD